MGLNLPPLPIRLSVNRTKVAAQGNSHISRQNDCALLERIAAALRALPSTGAPAQGCTGLPTECCLHGKQADKSAGQPGRAPS